MLWERVLTTVMRASSDRSLNIDHPDQVALPAPDPDTTYMLYAHVPFCERLCPYCSFNRFPHDQDRTRDYFRRLREEMRRVGDMGFRFGSMYVGGGTPTIMLDELCKTIDLARELFGDLEVSSETNPNHLGPEYVEALAPRVQRFSVGVQSFDDELLKQMDRYEKYGSGAQIIEALAGISGAFHSLNVDLIFNFPNQTTEKLARDIELLKDTGANQATFYPLMASPAVRRQLATTVGKVDYSREARFYQQICDSLEGIYEPTSAWCFSKVDGGMIDEYIVDYEQYVALGSGAFSFMGDALYSNTFSLKEYDSAIDAGCLPTTGVKRFSKREMARYRFLMGLFGLELDKAAFKREFRIPIDFALPGEMAFMRASGAFSRDDSEKLTLTPRGRYLMVAMMREFFAGVNNVRDQARAALDNDEQALLFGDGCGVAG